MLNPGQRVKMTAALKQRMRGDCLPGNHQGLDTQTFNNVSEDCMECSTSHIEEFGECEGVVIGLIDYNNVLPDHADYDPAKIGPEYDVRWQPSNLRYAYAESDLEVVP